MAKDNTDWINLSSAEVQQRQTEWQNTLNQMEADAKGVKDKAATTKQAASKAQNALSQKSSEISNAQAEVNRLVKEMADESQIAAAKAKKDKLTAELPALQENVKQTQKEYDEARKQADKVQKKINEHKENEPNKLRKKAEDAEEAAAEKARQEVEEKKRKAAEKKKKSQAKIQAALDKMCDPAENIHKTVCLKAGILPSTAYAIKFCEYLKANTELDENGECDWYSVDENNNSQMDGKALKKIKKEWILERAGEKQEKENDDAASATSDAVKAAEEADKKLAEAKNNNEKLKATEEKIKTLESNISKLNKEAKDTEAVIKKLEKNGAANNPKYAAQLTEAKSNLTNIKTEIKKYEDNIKNEKENVKGLKQKIKDAEKKAKEKEKDDKKLAQDIAKAEAWFKSNLKSWRQKYLDDAHKNYGSDKMKVIPDDVTKEELEKMAKYCVKDKANTNNLTFIELDKKDNAAQKNQVMKSIWGKKDSILSIKNDLDPKLLEKADEMTPDAAKECFSGAASNTFELASQGIAIAQNPEILAQKAMLMANATAAALDKLTTNVTNEVTSSLMKLMDVTPITQIPLNAAQEMLKHIWTPADIMKKIDADMNPDFLAEEAEKAAQNKINQATDKVNETVGEIQYTVGSKLEGYKKATDLILNTLNQGPMWYIDNVNKLEVKYEKEIIQNIQKVTIPALDAKFQFVDFMTAQIAYNLVAPVNQALEAAQLIILRKVIELKKLAIAKAKALAAAAIMKLLGLLGG